MGKGFNHVFVISVDVLLIGAISIYMLFNLRKMSSWRKFSRRECCCWPLILSISFNGVLGLVYLGTGVFLIVEGWKGEWLVLVSQGLTWLLLLTSTLSFSKDQFSRGTNAAKLCFIIFVSLLLLLASFLCITSVWIAFVNTEISVKIVLDILSFPGSILLVISTFQNKNTLDDSLYEPLQAEDQILGEGEAEITSFSTAGLLSKLTFWWLNPLMRKGKEKALEDSDVPRLRLEDRARTCYSVFMELLLSQKPKTVVSTLILWQWKPVLVAGLFALIKVISISTCPIFLWLFIRLAQGEQAFRYEVYVLTAGLFAVKCLESFAERHWFFRMRLVGVQLRSMFSAAIYKKLLKVSPSSSSTSGEIVSLVIIDAYRLGEFPFLLHQIWATPLQIGLALIIVYYCLGLAALAAVLVIVLTVLANSPVAKIQATYQRKLMEEQDTMVQFISVSLSAMKVLKLYAWDSHFKKIIEGLREEEYKWLNAVQVQKAYYLILFWLAPVLVPVAVFATCYYILGAALTTANVFTFLATISLIQESIKLLPDVVGSFIDAKVSLDRIMAFLEAPELQRPCLASARKDIWKQEAISIETVGISWDGNSQRPNLRNIHMVVNAGEKVAICGEVGAGKTTLLAAILGEVPNVDGRVQVNGKMAYVSQTAWIQTGTIQENILFGSSMDSARYEDTLTKCCLVKDLEMLPFGDLTVIGERGVNLSGGQKQRVQLARALYQNADIYLLDDPFSAVDAHTATRLFNEYVMEALAGKTILLVTHQVDFLPAFHSILLMSEGEVLRAGTYHELLASSEEFSSLVHAHSNVSSKNLSDNSISNSNNSKPEILKTNNSEQITQGDQLIKEEEKDTGDSGLKPYVQYLKHGKGFLYVALGITAHIIFIFGQFAQSCWLAANLRSSSTSEGKLVAVYALIACFMFVFLFLRGVFIVLLANGASRSIFSSLINSIFSAPMSFYDSTPLGRILSRISSDLSIVDLDLPNRLLITIGSAMITYFCYGILAVLAWEILFLIIPMIYLTIVLQRYFFNTAEELMRINGTTKSALASQIAETVAGVTTIRALQGEDQFFTKNLDLIDKDASPFFHSFSANEWFIQRLEMACAVVLSAAALFMTVFSHSVSSGG